MTKRLWSAITLIAMLFCASMAIASSSAPSQLGGVFDTTTGRLIGITQFGIAGSKPQTPILQDGLGMLQGPDGLPPASALTPSLKGPLATYSTSIASTTGVALSNARAPWMWQSTQGFTEYLSNTLIKGVGYDIGTKVYALGTADHNWYVYDRANPGWVKKTASPIDAGTGIFNLMFTTGSGTHFVAWGPNASHTGAQNLYRSTDDGATWSAVLTSTQMPQPDDYIGSMAEGADGTLMTTVYNGVAAAGTATKAVFRSTDGGLTWTNITAAVNAATSYQRHIHLVVYDQYRSCWWIDGGDNAAAYIAYSKDNGTTWTAWTKSWQATSILPTPTALIFQSDVGTSNGLGGYHDLIRIPSPASAGPEGVVAQDPRSHIVFKLGQSRSPVSPIAGMAGDEFSFLAYRNAYGILCISVGKTTHSGHAAYLVSADDGQTWTDALGGTSSTQSAAAQNGVTIFGWEPIFPSWRAAWGGRLIAYPNASTYVSRSIRIMPAATPLHVNAQTGDDIWGDGITTPLASLEHPGLPAGTRTILDTDVSNPVTITQPGLIVDRNGHTLGSADPGGSYTINENFEGTSSLTTTTSGTGTAVQNSTANPYSDPFLPASAQHARLSITSANDTAFLTKSNALTGIADGTQVCFKVRASFNVASISSVLTWLQLQGGVNVSIQTSGAMQVTTVGDSRIYQQHSLDLQAVSFNAYQGVKLVVYKHPTAGWIKLYQITQDGPTQIYKLVIYVRDVNTTGTGWTSPRVGIISGGQASMQIDVDNEQLSSGFDCDIPPAYTLGAPGDLVLPEMAGS